MAFIEVFVAARTAFCCLTGLLLATIGRETACAQDASRDQLLHYSLQVDVDDEARTQIATSEAELSRGDVLTAASRWRALLESPRPNSVVPFRGSFLTVREVVAAILRSEPAAVQDEYQRLTAPIAERVLQQAIQRDDAAALWTVVDRFPMTRSAEQARIRLAERCFDAGRFSQCAQLVDNWLDELRDPHSSVAAVPMMLVWRTLALESIGDHEAAASRWMEFMGDVPGDLRQLVTSNATARLVPLPADSVPPAAAAISDVSELFPSESVIWSQELRRADNTQEWSSIASDFEELAHALLMVNAPAVTPHGVVVTGEGKRVLESASGEPRWMEPQRNSSPGGLRVASIDSLRDALGESTAARSIVSGDRIYSVEPVPGRQGTFYANRLVARSVTTGDVVWSVAEFPSPDRKSLAPAFLLGPPAERQGVLFVAVESDEQLSLAALDAGTSKLLWMTRLGDAGLSLMVDSRRRWMPAVLMAGHDAVLCATGNGAVACLEPLAGHVQWIHRAEREDWRNAGPPSGQLPSNAPRFRMWSGWREPTLARFGDVIVWAGPESDALTALDRTTGDVRWSQPRSNGLAVVATASHLLVIAEQEVRRVNPADGSTVWSAPIAGAAGTGFAAGRWYVLPLRTGGTVAIDLENGAVTRSVAWQREVVAPASRSLDSLRTLRRTPAGLLVQTPVSVTLHRSVAEVKRTSPAGSPSTPLLAAAGQLTEAEASLADSTADDMAQWVRWRNRLKLISQETAADQFHLATRPAAQGPPSVPNADVEDRVAAFLLDRRPETAIALLRSTPLASLADVWVESNRDPHRGLRADVAAVSTLAEHLSSVDHQRALQELLTAIEAARPDDARGLLDLLKSTEWSARQLLVRLEKSNGPRSVQALARDRLALLHLQSLGGDIHQQAARLSTSLTPPTPKVADWPETTPIDSKRDWNSLIDARPVPIEPLGPTELSQLSIDLKITGIAISRPRPGLGVHFSGCGEDRPWEIDLPKTNRSLEQMTDYRHASMIGPLVLLQAGTGLFALLPLDATGDRGASKLWTLPWVDMWGGVSNHSVSFLPRLSDVAPGRHPLDLDDFGRPLTQVGPVTASYFCYRQFDRLVACETATGRRLWDRQPFDPDALATGDGSTVVLVSPRRNRIELLDPLDGRLVSSRPLGFPSRRWRTALGATAILRSGQPAVPGGVAVEPSGLAAMNLKDGSLLWKQPLEAAAVDFMVGQRFVGALESQAIRLFDPATGSEAARIAITPPANVTDVYAINDPHALMLCVTGPPAVEQLRPPLMLIGGRRRPYANGRIYALDPQTLQLKWSIPIEKSVFPLDQPRDIPLLVIYDAVIASRVDEHELEENRIRCFDKRTGQPLPELQGDLIGRSGITIERDQVDGWVEIRTSRAIFRYDYTP